jgi:Skp family chaperone for outer membrane proteins
MTFSNRSTSRVRGVLIALGVAASTIGVYQVMAQKVPVAGTPTRIAVVQKHLLLEALESRAADHTALTAMQQHFKTEVEKKEAELKQRIEEAKAVTDPAKRESLEDDIQLEFLYGKLWAAQMEREIGVEEAVRYEKLDMQIKSAIKELAVAGSYDLVLVDDSSVEPATNKDSDVPVSAQRALSLASRRILYINPAIDITDELSVRMNNAFKASAP